MTAPYSSSRFAYEGTETTETSIVRTGGAEDPAGQAQSRKIVTSANAQWLRPFRCEPWAIWNETTGADVTVTVYGVAEGALPENCDVWLDVEYQQSDGLGKIVTTTKSNVLATCTSVASDSSTWSTPTYSSEATQFLDRTSGLDTTHTNAYVALIDGLVTDGLWSKFDVLHIYATQNSTTANLNLVSSSYNATAIGSPTFTADRGYTGVESSSICLNLNFNPSTAPTPKFVQNSAHLSAWIVTNGQGTACLGHGGASGIPSTYLFPRSTTTNLCYLRINALTGGSETVANSDSRGHFISNRSGSAAAQEYLNGSSIFTHTKSSISVHNSNMYSIGWNSDGVVFGYGQQEAMISVGSSLNGTEALAFYNRLRTYMTAVGVP